MKKIAIITLVLITVGCQPKTDKLVTIGILQTASHPALDAARAGFKHELHKHYAGKIRFIEQNAEGSAAQAQSIMKSFARNKQIDGIYAIASLAAQTAAQIEKQKPIFIDAVTDPKALGILGPGTNVCGSSDRTNSQKQVELIKTLIPNAKKITILYNPAETNSLAVIGEMAQELTKQGIQNDKLGVANHADIKTVVTKAARSASALLVPADNLLVSAMPLVSKTALKMNIPVIASDVPSVKQGALAAQGVDYFQSGLATARIAAIVLRGDKKPHELPIINNSEPVIHLNETVAAKLGLKIPQALKKQAKIVLGDI